MTRQSSLTYISLEAIQPSPYQPRKYFKEQDLLDLAKSIHKIGLLHPPVVRLLKTGCYELVSGERRLRAAKLAGLQEIPVILREMDTEISAEACLIENIQRVDLSAIEVARGLHKLIQTFAYNQGQLADKVGKKRSTIANYLRLLSLPHRIQESIVEGKLSMGQAKVILSLPTPVQQEILHHAIITKHLTVKQAEAKAQELLAKESPCIPNKGKKELTHQALIKDVEEKLSQHLGTKTNLRYQAAKTQGAITLHFYSLDDLDRLLELLGVRL